MLKLEICFLNDFIISKINDFKTIKFINVKIVSINMSNYFLGLDCSTQSLTAVVIDFDLEPIVDDKKTILNIIFGTTPVDKLVFYVENYGHFGCVDILRIRRGQEKEAKNLKVYYYNGKEYWECKRFYDENSKEYFYLPYRKLEINMEGMTCGRF